MRGELFEGGGDAIPGFLITIDKLRTVTETAGDDEERAAAHELGEVNGFMENGNALFADGGIVVVEPSLLDGRRGPEADDGDLVFAGGGGDAAGLIARSGGVELIGESYFNAFKTGVSSQGELLIERSGRWKNGVANALDELRGGRSEERRGGERNELAALHFRWIVAWTTNRGLCARQRYGLESTTICQLPKNSSPKSSG